MYLILKTLVEISCSLYYDARNDKNCSFLENYKPHFVLHILLIIYWVMIGIFFSGYVESIRNEIYLKIEFLWFKRRWSPLIVVTTINALSTVSPCLSSIDWRTYLTHAVRNQDPICYMQLKQTHPKGGRPMHVNSPIHRRVQK